MTRDQIIAKARHFLNEEVARFWTNDELYSYGFTCELDLIRLLNDNYTKDYRERTDLIDTNSCPYFPDAALVQLPAGFIREVKVYTERTNVLIGDQSRLNEADYVEFDNLHAYKEIGYIVPTQREPIYWFDTIPAVETATGVELLKDCIGLSPAPTSEFKWHLIYLSAPADWTTSNSTAPPLYLEAHELLVFGIVRLALEDDGEFTSAARFEKLYNDGIQKLGIRPAIKKGTRP